MADSIREELEAQIAAAKVKLEALKNALEEIELRENIVETKYVTFQLSETFAELSWQEAMDLPRTLNEKKYLGFDDWYLPSASELYALIDAGHIPKFKKANKTRGTWDQTTGCWTGNYSTDGICWSSTTGKKSDDAKKVDFDLRSISTSTITTAHFVICVRKVSGTVSVQDIIAEPAEVEDGQDFTVIGD